nr:pyridoxal-phosphate dependent enzyme [Alphaproteobacteria bacterium]
VAEAAARAAAEGWHLVSDTSRPGYEETPLAVMQGYTVMAKEALDQMAARGATPSHILVQGGVGGLAAAVFAYAAERLGAARPTMVVAEPEAANCLLRSAERGHCVSIGAHPETVMGMLDCGEPSYVAWRVLELTADAFLDLPDAAAIEAMRRLAEPSPGDPPVVCGESGAAGLAGLMAAARNGEWRDALGLGADSVALVFGTEGATDPEIYRRLTGHAPEEVQQGQGPQAP